MLEMQVFVWNPVLFHCFVNDLSTEISSVDKPLGPLDRIAFLRLGRVRVHLERRVHVPVA